jgi:hypothetical protein
MILLDTRPSTYRPHEKWYFYIEKYENRLVLAAKIKSSKTLEFTTPYVRPISSFFNGFPEKFQLSVSEKLDIALSRIFELEW